MPLTRYDVEVLTKLGYRLNEFSVKDRSGIRRLRNVNGHCYFLDPHNGSCKVYRYRPLGCRLYPLICVPGEGVKVDRECPLHNLVGENTVKELAPYVRRLVKMVYGVEC
jgi:Fe-S-cluster containining protein